MQPRPESRIKSLENRTTDIEASLQELSNDTAEELNAIRQEIKSSYHSIGDTFVATWADTKARLATKEDIAEVNARLDRIEQEHGKMLQEILNRLPKGDAGTDAERRERDTWIQRQEEGE